MGRVCAFAYGLIVGCFAAFPMFGALVPTPAPAIEHPGETDTQRRPKPAWFRGKHSW